MPRSLPSATQSDIWGERHGWAPAISFRAAAGL